MSYKRRYYDAKPGTEKFKGKRFRPLDHRRQNIRFCRSDGVRSNNYITERENSKRKKGEILFIIIDRDIIIYNNT